MPTRQLKLSGVTPSNMASDVQGYATSLMNGSTAGMSKTVVFRLGNLFDQYLETRKHRFHEASTILALYQGAIHEASYPQGFNADEG